MEHGNISIDILYLSLHLLGSFLNAFTWPSKVSDLLAIGAILRLDTAATGRIRWCASTLAKVVGSSTWTCLQMASTANNSARELACLVSLERRVAWVIARNLRHIDSVVEIHARIGPVLELVLEAWCQSRNTLLCRHVSQSAIAHWVLQSTEVASLGIFALQKVIYWHCIVACHGLTVLPVMSDHMMVLFYIVQEGCWDCSDTSLIAWFVLCHDHVRADFACAVRSSTCSCVHVHRVLSLRVHLLASISIRESRAHDLRTVVLW